jgi:hypothetical protein
VCPVSLHCRVGLLIEIFETTCAFLDISTSDVRHTMAGESGTVTLHELIAAHREENHAAPRPVPRPAEAEINHGVALFLDQLVRALRPGPSSSPEIGTSAGLHGHDLLLQGFTVGQVVHGYRDVRQSITDLAVEMDAPLTPDDCRTLNRCFDDAVAAAVTEHGAERHPLAEDEGARWRERAHRVPGT